MRVAVVTSGCDVNGFSDYSRAVAVAPAAVDIATDASAVLIPVQRTTTARCMCAFVALLSGGSPLSVFNG